LLFSQLAKEFHHFKFVYPVHLNPNVKIPVYEKLKSIENFILTPPVDYLSFILLMKHSRFIISDSGGIQEECYSFKKPVIVLREVTERSEAVDDGYAFLAGHSTEKIKKIFYEVDRKISKGYNFFQKKNPFGDGKASRRIAEIVNKKLTES
jgi:UDP-N-acetylglucosamine 2-epimerase (non-hydrolysing)